MATRQAPHPRRVAAVIIAAVVGLIALAVVTSTTNAFQVLGQREAVVHFKNGTSRADKAKIRDACEKPPTVVGEPMGGKRAGRLNDLVFRVDDASDGQIATLSTCLKQYPSVIGVQVMDLTT